jgi:hypothetical protein
MCKRVERGTLLAERVGYLPQVIWERFVFM